MTQTAVINRGNTAETTEAAGQPNVRKETSKTPTANATKEIPEPACAHRALVAEVTDVSPLAFAPDHETVTTLEARLQLRCGLCGTPLAFAQPPTTGNHAPIVKLYPVDALAVKRALAKQQSAARPVQPAPKPQPVRQARRVKLQPAELLSRVDKAQARVVEMQNAIAEKSREADAEWFRRLRDLVMSIDDVRDGHPLGWLIAQAGARLAETILRATTRQGAEFADAMHPTSICRCLDGITESIQKTSREVEQPTRIPAPTAAKLRADGISPKAAAETWQLRRPDGSPDTNDAERILYGDGHAPLEIDRETPSVFVWPTDAPTRLVPLRELIDKLYQPTFRLLTKEHANDDD